ncbi:uncharacterized protein LOC119995518 [Tripterygium wilfordii]|uniref:uncharacterized protein LOC119995518 n=1 Tax=Tripterygium wilfordii TaxID=458696 RepID=UPI0018F7FB90|nr:uncharacterized protein LOC119995518 [Tripterygium wilfordii]
MGSYKKNIGRQVIRQRTKQGEKKNLRGRRETMGVVECKSHRFSRGCQGNEERNVFWEALKVGSTKLKFGLRKKFRLKVGERLSTLICPCTRKLGWSKLKLDFMCYLVREIGLEV